MAGVALVLLVLATGCQGKLVRRGSIRATPVDTGDTTVGEAVGVAGSPSPKVATPAPEAAKAGATATTKGTFVLTLVDGRGGKPDGITVEIKGPENVTVKSTQGKVQADVQPGSYTFAIPAGCRDEVFVSFGGTASAGISRPSQVVNGDLRVDWRHRFAPDRPVHANFVPDFPIGETVEVRYDVVDRCTADRVPHASYGWIDFKPSTNVRLVGPPPLRADGSGFGHLKLSCTAGGEARLVSQDRTNPIDQMELLVHAADRQPVCKK